MTDAAELVKLADDLTKIVDSMHQTGDWRLSEKEATLIVDEAAATLRAIAAQQDGAKQCERNFELMLGRLVYRARQGLNLSPTLEQAEELLKRLGSSNMRYEQ